MFPDTGDSVTANGVVIDEQARVRAVLCDEIADPVWHGGLCPGNARVLDAERSLVGGDGGFLGVVIADIRVGIATTCRDGALG